MFGLGVDIKSDWTFYNYPPRASEVSTLFQTSPVLPRCILQVIPKAPLNTSTSIPRLQSLQPTQHKPMDQSTPPPKRSEVVQRGCTTRRSKKSPSEQAALGAHPTILREKQSAPRSLKSLVCVTGFLGGMHDHSEWDGLDADDWPIE